MNAESLTARLDKLAQTFPGITTTGSCKKTSYKTKGKKSFLFLGMGKGDVPELMLKLQESIKDAQQLQDESPSLCKVGKGGWVTVRFDPTDQLDPEQLEQWIRESFHLFS